MPRKGQGNQTTPRESYAAELALLERELKELSNDFRGHKRDALFCAWFVRAYQADTFADAVESLTGAPRDKGMDAIFIDNNRECLLIVQAKARESINTKNEPRADVLALATLSSVLVMEEGNPELERFTRKLSHRAAAKLEEARAVITRGYRPQLCFATLWHVSDEIVRDARLALAPGIEASSLEVVDGTRFMILLKDYIDGVAPPVPSVQLSVEAGGMIEREKTENDIKTWVFAMNGNDLGALYKQNGKRIFARNIRGYLGDTQISEAMKATLRDAPSTFFYSNNGITIVCDKALEIQKTLLVSNPQIINGQQTTRALNREGAAASNASVLVRVISIPRTPGAEAGYDSIVTQVVKATNWQNPITPADLRSNDPIQVELERAFRQRGYQYLRKSETQRERAKSLGGHLPFKFTKERLSLAVGSCEQESLPYRAGPKKRFDEGVYEEIFGSRDVRHYLCCFWLVERISAIAKLEPVFGPAKWLACFIMWRDLEAFLKKDDTFIHSCEMAKGFSDGSPATKAFDRAAKAMLSALANYYERNKKRVKRGTEVLPDRFFRTYAKADNFEAEWPMRSRTTYLNAVDHTKATIEAARLSVASRA